MHFVLAVRSRLHDAELNLEAYAQGQIRILVTLPIRLEGCAAGEERPVSCDGTAWKTGPEGVPAPKQQKMTACTPSGARVYIETERWNTLLHLYDKHCGHYVAGQGIEDASVFRIID